MSNFSFSVSKAEANVIRLKRKPGEPHLGYCGLAGAPR